MMNKSVFYRKGIDFAIQEMYSENNTFDEIIEEIKRENGEEASNDFEKGYNLSLIIFIYASDHYHDSSSHLEKIINDIKQLYGEELKKSFILGLKYYHKLDDKEDINQKKK